MNTLKLNKYGRTWIRNQARSYPENWATEIEVFDFLYGMVRMVKPEKILEIGTFEGDTAIAMAKGLRDNNFGHLITLDIKDFNQENNIKEVGLEKYVKCIKDKPEQFLAELTNNYFDMAFIDDGHSYHEAMRDLENCHRLVKTHGYILGHDVLMVNSVNLAYTTFLDKHKAQYHNLIVSSYDGVFILKKLYD
jgi:predicted O-methyltransferase YrrM